METKNISNTTQFPVQTIPESKKTKDWMIECVNAAENMYTMDSSQVRTTWYNKRINQNLRNNILVQEDVERFLNPSGIKISTTPERMAHQGLGNTKIMLLKGEESKRLRKYDFKAFKTSADDMGVSSKEEEIKEMYIAKMQELIQSQDIEEEQMQKELEELQKYTRYTYQDLQEIIANKILRYEYERNDVADKIVNAWEQLLTFGEEIMAVEEYGNDIYIRNVNPLNFFCLLSPDSNLIEDSDIMVEYSYMSLRNVIDLYYDEISINDIKNLEKGYDVTYSAGSIRPGFNRNISVEERFGFNVGDLFLPNQVAPGFFSGAFDMRGNVRVMRVCWRSSRKIGKLKSYDDLGVPVFSEVPEGYKPDKSKGEEVEWIVINEWREGHKLGNDVFTRLRIIPYQQRSPYNLSECKPPYVGVISNFNQSRAMSLLDYMKPYDYLYDIVFYRYLMALSKYKGPITVINRSMIPTEIDPITYMNFIDSTNTMLLDPTNEILRGPNSGKSAGMFNQLTATSINSGMSGYVKDHIDMLGFIERQLDKISGINDARQGTTEGDERVSVNNMAWTASNSMTEPYYRLHDLFKRNLLRRILNVAKYVWSENPKKGAYVLDDIGIEMVSNFEDIADADYDIHVTSASDINDIKKLLEQLSHAAMQSGTMTISQVANMYMKDSVSGMLRYLEEKESEAKQAQAEAAQAEAQENQAERDMKMELEYAKLEAEYEKMDREDMNKQLDREADIEREAIKALGFAQDSDVDKDGIPDVIEQTKLALERSKQTQEAFNKAKEMSMKDRELRLKETQHKDSMQLEREKMKNDLKIAKTNKNRFDKK